MVASIHLLFVLFVVLGGVLVVRWPRLAWLHLPSATWGALIEFGGWICPLTPLENWLRREGGLAGFEGSFVERYILPILYPAELDRQLQLVLGSIVVVVNALVYGWLLYRRGRQPASAVDDVEG